MFVISKNLARSIILMTSYKISVDLHFEHCMPESPYKSRNYYNPNIIQINQRIAYYIKRFIKGDTRTEFLDNYELFAEVNKKVRRDLCVFRAECIMNFKKDKKFLSEILCKLGFLKYFVRAADGDLPSIYNILATFSQNMTLEMNQEIVNSGVDKDLIANLLTYCESFKELENFYDVSGESDRGKAKFLNEINLLYMEMLDICRLKNAYLWDKNYFSFFEHSISLKSHLFWHSYYEILF